ncbi:dihydropteroate synthase [Lacibacter luteus]|uniref:dihydropteroate synthase n=1 Tax=Lacibacter luteus TaxID=2508719 RepID=A0A4Q1CN59_9BACT|nr:dihydropteroate synthase [Lacibacter luteus]RXK62131.1 dihydropteroate synthase [Lacibacter luteus]
MYTLNCKGRLLTIDEPLVMGILNATPDSFYSSSRVQQTDEVLQKASAMIADGAAILDIGGQSTRPGSTRISAQEETTRVVPVIKTIKEQFPEIFISVDTYYSTVAKDAALAGADIVNDISAGDLDEAMLSTIADLKIPFIAMHMQGNPDTMQQNPQYENIAKEVVDYFIKKVEQCKRASINDIILDPGFGFGKTITHNFQLLKQMEALQMFNLPVLAGLSRKSTVWRTLNSSADEALNGTTVLNTIALTKGASILRVHDVKEAVEAVKLFTAYRKA